MTKLFLVTLLSAAVIATAPVLATTSAGDLAPIRVDPKAKKKKLNVDDETTREEQFLTSISKAAKNSNRKPASIIPSHLQKKTD